MRMFWIGFVAMAFGVGNANAMTITASVAKYGGVVIDATGTIQPGDLDKLKTAFQHASSHPKSKSTKSPLNRMLRVDTPGGDLAEAMLIGRWLRANKMAVVVPEQAKCFSSCVYLLAAGVVKYPLGFVGIHRPYFVRAPSGSVDAAMKRALRDSQEYFSEMNIVAQLADAMFSTPPEHIELLGDAKLRSYRLDQEDFAYAEERDIQAAAQFGMSREEFLLRSRQYDEALKRCSNLKDRALMDCANRASKASGFR